MVYSRINENGLIFYYLIFFINKKGVISYKIRKLFFDKVGDVNQFGHKIILIKKIKD